MMIQQTIEIPADKRIIIEVPETFTSGAISFDTCAVAKLFAIVLP
jgi:hypothetical protein